MRWLILLILFLAPTLLAIAELDRQHDERMRVSLQRELRERRIEREVVFARNEIERAKHQLEQLASETAARRTRNAGETTTAASTWTNGFDGASQAKEGENYEKSIVRQPSIGAAPKHDAVQSRPIDMNAPKLSSLQINAPRPDPVKTQANIPKPISNVASSPVPSWSDWMAIWQKPREQSPRSAAASLSNPNVPTDHPAFQRARDLLQQGDIIGARMLLEWELRHGYTRAAYLLGDTYNPTILERWHAEDVRGDMIRARDLYRQAAKPE